MGRIKYNYFKLTITSMKFNPNVTFVLINVIPEDANYWTHYQQVIQEFQVPNLIYKVITIRQWKDLVKQKLQIDVPFTMDWYYKLCDYKPTLGYLFSDLIYENPNDFSTSKYRYWGYCDLDVVWGNFQKFAHLFQGQYYFIRTSAHITVGMAQFFRLDEFTLKIYELDSQYISLLTSPHYHNLDELGQLTNHPIENGAHSINSIVNRLHDQDPMKYNYPHSSHFYDHLFLEMYHNYREHPIPTVLWSQGNLRMVHSRLNFPSGRDLLFVHRIPQLQQIPKLIRNEVIEDMINYGYLLPNWIPLFTRHMCPRPHESLDEDGDRWGIYSYYPYNRTCFGKGYYNQEN
jgi:hypothetical protein